MKYDLSNIVDRNKAQVKLNDLKTKGKAIELKVLHPARSLQHNKYLHVCISIFAIEFGYTLDEAKTLLKRECDFMIYDKNGKKFLRHTSKMDSSELSKFIEWIRNYSAQNGCYIPDADEYRNQSVHIDNLIESHREHL